MEMDGNSRSRSQIMYVRISLHAMLYVVKHKYNFINSYISEMSFSLISSINVYICFVCVTIQSQTKYILLIYCIYQRILYM